MEMNKTAILDSSEVEKTPRIRHDVVRPIFIWRKSMAAEKFFVTPCTLVGKFFYLWDFVGASHVSTAPTKSSFLT